MFEVRLTPSSFMELSLLTSSLAGLAALLLLHYFVSAFWKVQLLGRRVESFLYQAVATMLCILALVWQLHFFSETRDTLPLWSVGIAFALGVLAWQALKLLASRVSHSQSQWTLASISLVLVMGNGAATRMLIEPVNELLFSSLPPGELVESVSFRGITDKGSPIKLHEREISAQKFQDHVTKSKASIAELAQDSIEYCEPQAMSNCHGWVFAEGKHLLKGEDVQTVLDENGYSTVAEPQVGDVIIYRDGDGIIIHSGIVRSALENGSILVESKWGFASTYLHLANNQPYSPEYSYYRSSRNGHALKLETPEPCNLASTGTNAPDTESIN